MKTTVNININKQAFIIDEDAYQKLASYIENIRSRFNNEVEAKEVIEDIEARIAELFSKQTNSMNPVVDLRMVDDIILKLGRPEDIFMEDESENKQASNVSPSNSTRRINRKLYRNPDDKKITGLLSGMGLYIGYDDASVIRIIFLVSFVGLAFITGGASVVFIPIIYFILAAVIPLANTASEKLQMRGEDVNLNNIKNNVVNEMNRGLNSASSFGHGIMNNSSSTVKDIFSGIGKAIAGMFVFSSISSLFISIFIFILIIAGSNTDVANMFVSNLVDLHIANIGLLLVGIIPSIAIIYYGLRWILGNSIRRPGISWLLIGLFVVGSILLSYVATKQVIEWQSNKKVYNEIDITSVKSDTIKIISKNNKNINNDGTNFTFGNFEVNGLSRIGDEIYWRNSELDIIKGDKLILSKNIISQGSNEENALSKIRNVKYSMYSDSNSIIFDDFYSFPLKDRVRAQKVKLVLEVPVGKVIYLDKSTKNFIYDIDNVTNTYDKEMVGHYWLMTEQGLKCLDKVFKDENEDEEDNEEELNNAADSIKSDLKNAENVDININSNGVSLSIDKKDGTDSKITIKDNKDKGANIKIEKNGVEEKVIHIKNKSN